MGTLRSFALLAAAALSGAVAMVAQTLLLQRFLWQFEAAEMGVALFLSGWLFWFGMGAAASSTSFGRCVADKLAQFVWVLLVLCGALYFVQYALIANIRGWMGVPEYQTFPLGDLTFGCLIANAPFCFVAGWVIPTISRGLVPLSVPVSRAFAWESLGAAVGGFALLATLLTGRVPDPRDESEWTRCFPDATGRPGRFATGGGATFYGYHRETFYVLSSSGVREVIPEGDRAMEQAVLMLSQRPYAKRVLLMGQVPLATGLALEMMRPDLSIVWCPCDADYGVKLLTVAGLHTKVQAAGEAPQRFLGMQREGAFDIVMARPPSAASLAGTAWRETGFVREVRRVTQRTGIALFGLDFEAALVLPEKAALLDATLRPVRLIWPEDGCFIPCAGGWWAAAQVPRLVYTSDAAAARFARLKLQAVFPTEAVARLYDTERVQRLILQCPILDQSSAMLLSDTAKAEEILSAGLADAIREAYPESTPLRWFAQIKACDGARMAGLLLVILWMLPVTLGLTRTASRRLLAAWLASCGALGLAVSLAILYRIQMRFGDVYFWAGTGSCLYLAGLFCGNRLGTRLIGLFKDAVSFMRYAILSATGVQAIVAVGALTCLEWTTSSMSSVGFCFVAGCAAGVSVPLALASAERQSLQNAAVFVLADAFGAAIAGLLFVLLVPFSGLFGTVTFFAVLACGLSVCVVLSGPYARLTSGLALVVSLAILGGRVSDVLRDNSVTAAGESKGELTVRGTCGKRTSADKIIRGIPRTIDESLIRAQMMEGHLSTNAAVFWERR